jgi:hypothetical protein
VGTRHRPGAACEEDGRQHHDGATSSPLQLLPAALTCHKTTTSGGPDRLSGRPAPRLRAPRVSVSAITAVVPTADTALPSPEVTSGRDASG